MNNYIWGPKAWFFLHTITFNYPENPTKNDKLNYKNFFKSLQYVLPCKVCKKNYINHINEFPIDDFLNSKDDIVKWLINIHNEVNKILKKPIINYEDVIEYYNNIYNNNNYNIIYIVIILILIIIILYILL